MYDSGNMLSIKYGQAMWTVALEYTACGSPRDTNVGDAGYVTCFSQGYFTAQFWSASANLTGFRVTGNLGADGQGDVQGGALSGSNGGYYGFYKSVDDGAQRDPTVNHLVLVDKAGWQQNYSSTTNKDDHAVTGPGATSIIYVLFADPPTRSRPSRETFIRLMNVAVPCSPLRQSGALIYTDCGDSTSVPGFDGVSYSTCFDNGFFVLTLRSTVPKLIGLEVSGDLGADGRGVVAGGTLGQSAPQGFWGFYKSVHDGRIGDPSVNHLVLVNSASWSQGYSTSTNDDLHLLRGSSLASEVTFILFATPSSSASPSVGVFRQLMNGKARCSWSDNQCFSVAAASFMGRLHSIAGVETGSTSIMDGGDDSKSGN